jgi:hypothetical protein
VPIKGCQATWIRKHPLLVGGFRVLHYEKLIAMSSEQRTHFNHMFKNETSKSGYDAWVE